MFRIILNIIFILSLINGQKILIPMDQTQNDHLKAYGIAYYVLKRNINVEWLLNFQGGSFLIDDHPFIQAECKIRGVTFLEVQNQWSIFIQLLNKIIWMLFYLKKLLK